MQDNNNYSYISTIIDMENNTHYVKDAEAREAISDLEVSKQDVIDASHKLPASSISGLADVATSGDYTDLINTPVADSTMSDSSENAVQNKVIKKYVDDKISDLGDVFDIKGTKASEAEIKAITSAKKGDVWINTADNSEWFATKNISAADATAWEKFGVVVDLSGYAKTEDLGDLAYKDTASASYTPAGSVTVDAYTPEGSISMSPYTPTGNVSINSITPAGSIEVGNGAVNYTPAGSVAIDSITPAGSIGVGSGTANYTPSGSVSINSITPAGAISVGDGTANYTPAGSVTVDAYTPEGTVSAPTITVEASTTTVNSITDVGTLPELEMSVANETLTFSFSQGTLPTKGTNTTVATGIANASATAPTFSGTAKAPTGSFTGTGVDLEFAGTAVTPSGSFSGNGVELEFTGSAVTPTGSFSGTGVDLEFSGDAVTPTGSFSGTAVAPSGSFTGTAKAPTGSFAGTSETITVS